VLVFIVQINIMSKDQSFRNDSEYIYMLTLSN